MMKLAAIAALAVAGLSTPLVVKYSTVETTRVEIESKERINDKYMIFTNGEVFENTDDLWFFKFNSSDVYSKAKPATTCDVKVNGFRVPFLSMYRNIIKIENCA